MRGDRGLRALESFRSADVVKGLVGRIRALAQHDLGGRHVKFMHVCGSHEHTITYFGLRPLLPDCLELVSGPGCPVCVCSSKDIREAMDVAEKGAVLCTFGDMLRDRTAYGSLDDSRARGADVRVIYSPADALKIARENPGREVVMFGVGFETSSAPVGSLALDRCPDNLSLLTSLKRTSPAVEALLRGGELALDGVIAPGHVSSVVGANDWRNLTTEFGIPTIISGFEPADVLISLVRLLECMRDEKPELLIEYRRLVSFEGNRRAQEVLSRAFEVRPAFWRAMGEVPGSGYFLRDEFERLDARKRFDVERPLEPERDAPPGCMCHLVVTGRAYPSDCALFRERACRPDSPSGPCMVSGEGTCYIWFRYGSGQALKEKLGKEAD